MISFKMPSLGADMEDGTLVEWRKQPGDALTRGDIIADVETQKGLIEIEFFGEGILEKHLVSEGQKVPVGTVIALVKPEGESLSSPVVEIPPSSREAPKPSPKVVEVSADKIPGSVHVPEVRVKISPLAKKMAEANQVDISVIAGTGPEGAIVKEDIERFLNSREKPETTPPSSKIESPEPSRPSVPQSESIRMAVAAAMSRSNREIPHYYLEKRVDMSKALDWLKEANNQRPVQKRLLPVALLIKAVAKALDEAPDLNAVWENGIKRMNEIHIGFVVSLRSGGIMVPAILNADLKTVDEIMETLNDLIPRTRAFKLRSSELSLSTFTITNMGEGGADKVFGIVYPPQVGIVGFGEIREEAVVDQGMIGIRPVMDVTLAADHRATDGLIGGKFLAALNRHLQNPESL